MKVFFLHLVNVNECKIPLLNLKNTFMMIFMLFSSGQEDMLKQKRIILLEAGPRQNFTLKETYNNRTCTLSPASIALFNSQYNNSILCSFELLCKKTWLLGFRLSTNQAVQPQKMARGLKFRK